MDMDKLDALARKIGWLAFGPGTELGTPELQAAAEEAVRIALGQPCAMELSFDVDGPEDASAGLRAYTNRLTVTTSDHPGGEPGEFEKFLTSMLAEWFDGARIICTWVVE